MKKLIFLLILLITLHSVYADYLYRNDRLVTGNGPSSEHIKTYTLGSRSYTLELVLCDEGQQRCVFNLYGEYPYKNIAINEQFNLGQDYYLILNSIVFDFCDDRRFCDIYNDVYDIANFSIFGRGEPPSSNNNNPPPAICGDNICSDGEDCNEDKCCDGFQIDLQTNYDHCGGCWIRCGFREQCITGICRDMCGESPCPIAEDEDNDAIQDGIDLCKKTPKECIVDKYGCPQDSDDDGICNELDNETSEQSKAIVPSESQQKNSLQQDTQRNENQKENTQQGKKDWLLLGTILFILVLVVVIVIYWAFKT